MSSRNRDPLLETLEARFAENVHRHPGIAWADVEARLRRDAGALRALGEMERTGGEPDVVGHDPKTGHVTFCDCSAESPKGRRSLCYDGEARTSRNEHPPKGSALEMAAAMGVELLTEAEYRALQELEESGGEGGGCQGNAAKSHGWPRSWSAAPSRIGARGGLS